jgi:hypothetical protein
MATKKLSVFTTLNNINVNEFKEKKGKYDFLSWSDAVQLVLTIYPDTIWETHEFDIPVTRNDWDGYLKAPYMITDSGCFVKVSLTIEGITRTEVHAVMDNLNKSVKSPTATQINNSIKRCLVKCFALFGLGLYIYRGEDLPEIDTPKAITEEEYQYLMSLIKDKDDNFKNSIETAINNEKLNSSNIDAYIKQFSIKNKKKTKEEK